MFQSVEEGYPVHGAPAARKGNADDFPAGLRVVDTAGPAFIPPPSPVHGADVTEREFHGGGNNSCIPLFLFLKSQGTFSSNDVNVSQIDKCNNGEQGGDKRERWR